MGRDSKIEWTHHTFNPWIGCSKVSPGCAHCYAETLMDTRYKRVKWGPDGTRVRTADKYWCQPADWNLAAGLAGQRHRVFCASLADVFEDRPELEPWRIDLFKMIDATPHLDWLLLTKRPQNVPAMWPGGYRHNVWRGTSVENTASCDRIDQLTASAKLSPISFLSVEPLLGPLHLSKFFHCDEPLCECRQRPNIDWVIVGGESGPNARAVHPDWVRRVRDDCRHGGVPFFFKQWGEWLPSGQTASGAIECRPTSVVLDGVVMMRFGKKAAGRLLDGRTWDEVPLPVEAV